MCVILRAGKAGKRRRTQMEEKLVKAAGRRRKDIQFLVVSEKGRDKINPAGNSLAERIYTKEVDRLSSKVLSDQRTKLVHKTTVDRLIATKKKLVL